MTIQEIENIIRRDSLSGPCDDDYEATCPYVGILPEETDNEEPSPLSF